MKTISSTIVVLVLSIGLPVTAVYAHGSGQHVMGVVTAIADGQMEVKQPKGEPVRVLLNDKTRYRSKGSAQPLPQVGDRVFIDVAKDGTGLSAKEVQFATPAKTQE